MQCNYKKCTNYTFYDNNKIHIFIKDLHFNTIWQSENVINVVRGSTISLRNNYSFLNTPRISSRISYLPKISIFKRFMNKAAKISLLLLPKMIPKISKRSPSFVAKGTLLDYNDYKDISKILYFNNQYLFNLNLRDSIDKQTFKFYQDIIFINPKFFQHIISVTYPEASYSADELRAFFPNIMIDGGKKDLFITEDVLVAATAASTIKKNSIFEKGLLTVLSCDYDPKSKKKVSDPNAFIQTKQDHPDYIYIYRPSSNFSGIWVRYYDYKTGKFNINTGHIICTSNFKEYEDVLCNPQLTWAERNSQIQEFWRDNLHKYPSLNPSYIIYNPSIYEVDNQSIPKKLSSLVIEASVETVENTQIMLAKAIILGGKTCQYNYLSHPYKNPIIVDMIKEYINNLQG